MTQLSLVSTNLTQRSKGLAERRLLKADVSVRVYRMEATEEAKKQRCSRYARGPIGVDTEIQMNRECET